MLVTCKEVHLEINTEKTECMLMSREHTAWRKCKHKHRKYVVRKHEGVEVFGKDTDVSKIQARTSYEQTERRKGLIWPRTQRRYRLLSKNTDITKYRSAFVHLVLCGCVKGRTQGERPERGLHNFFFQRATNVIAGWLVKRTGKKSRQLLHCRIVFVTFLYVIHACGRGLHAACLCGLSTAF